jgi:Flp pilus assembly protein TadD
VEPAPRRRDPPFASRPALAAGAALFLVTLITFAPSLLGEFLDWDDSVNFAGNPHYRGLGWPHVRWMLTSAWMGHWIPVTWVTLAVDHALWGMNPAGYHLTSVLVHAVNAVLVFCLARRLLARAAPGWGRGTREVAALTAALLFAVHPLRVESVAWVTERRDVVSGCFLLLTLLAYLAAADGRARRTWLGLSLLCYALALMSKSIVATLPAWLVLLDLYPLRRLGARPREWLSASSRPVWLEKIPYLALAGAGAAVALLAVRAHGFLTPLAEQPLLCRMAMAFHSLAFYLEKTLVPLGLSPLYEMPPRIDPWAPRFTLSALAVVAVSAAAVALRRRAPAVLVGWVSYGVALAPVSGLLHNGAQLVADRYTYLACLGLAVIGGAGLGAVVDARARGLLRPPAARLAVGTAALLVAGLAVLTWQQIDVWRTSERLWRQTLDVDPECAICHHRLGLILDRRGRTPEALEHFERAQRRNPDHTPSLLSVSTALVRMGRAGEAVERLSARLARAPADAPLRSHLGFALLEQGRPGEAIGHLEAAVRLDPADPQSLTNLGITLVSLERPAEAVPHLRRAIELSAADPMPRYWLARAWLAAGDPDAARTEAQRLRGLDPVRAEQLLTTARPGPARRRPSPRRGGRRRPPIPPLPPRGCGWPRRPGDPPAGRARAGPTRAAPPRAAPPRGRRRRPARRSPRSAPRPG